MISPQWKQTEASIFFSKNDPQDIRLGECVSSQAGSFDATAPSNLMIWGYPDHEGIQLNGGRLGAAEAPDAIRRIFYKMTPHVGLSKRPRLLDLGNINTELSLKDRHEKGASLAQAATLSDRSWASLGGGHDYGYADGAGFLRAHLSENRRPLVINLDAHLDVRPTDKGYNSGTPFFRLLSEFKGQFDFFEMGLQPHCNSAAHWNWALAQGAKLLPLSEINERGLLLTLQQTLAPFLSRPLWLSLDIDALTSTEAPGCSQSWTTGLKTDELMESLSWLMDNFSWKAFSIYEVSPPLDSDLRTVKLAAQFLHHFLSLRLEKGER